MCGHQSNSRGEVMNEITTVGMDLAKQVVSVHGVDGRGRVILQRTIRREKLLELVAQLPRCLIGMEACSGAHDWARRFLALGHDVRLMAPKFVVAYRQGGKNDGNDAAAICEAVGRPSMRFVPVKSVEQQSVLTLHRVRQGFVEERTATMNRRITCAVATCSSLIFSRKATRYCIRLSSACARSRAGGGRRRDPLALRPTRRRRRAPG
jgi:Transposase